MSDVTPNVTPPAEEEPLGVKDTAEGPTTLEQMNALLREHIASQQAQSQDVAQLQQQNALLIQQLNELRGNRGVAAPGANYQTHVVTQDQEHNLPAVADQHGVDPAIVYAHNSVTLEGNAAARGFRDSEGGRLVWPGTELKIPQS